MPTSRHTIQQQQQHVADWQLSGLSRTQYSLQHHLNVKTFCNWGKHAVNSPC
uniref:IS66 family insertion sequence element accessory protein TnpA n=1 Tax=Serratia entomophila TaxID=42906 RepID=UPI003B637B70